jgi:hypothetical protein
MKCPLYPPRGDAHRGPGRVADALSRAMMRPRWPGAATPGRNRRRTSRISITPSSPSMVTTCSVGVTRPGLATRAPGGGKVLRISLRRNGSSGRPGNGPFRVDSRSYPVAGGGTPHGQLRHRSRQVCPKNSCACEIANRHLPCQRDLVTLRELNWREKIHWHETC